MEVLKQRFKDLILDAFKYGSQDSAAFWIELGGKLIYIRYFPVRDADGHYRGCLEVRQDLTEIRKLGRTKPPAGLGIKGLTVF